VKHTAIILSVILLISQAGYAVEIPGAGAPQVATLVVKVTNGTPDGSSPAGDPITVKIFAHDQLMHTLKETVGADGAVVFEDIPAGERLLALAQVQHQGIAFSGQAVRLLARDEPIESAVTVYDHSSDLSQLTVSMHHVIIESQASSLVITEMLYLNNNSDTAIGGEKTNEPVVSIGLPEGYANLTPRSYFQQEALVMSEDGFYDTMAVAPGSYEVSFSYTLDVESAAMDIARKITLETSRLVIFVKVPFLKIEGLEVARSSMKDSEGAPIEYYTKSDLAAGEQLSFRISGFNTGTSSYSMWLILSVVFGAVAVLAIARAILCTSGQDNVKGG
jgi:hypothetical protein